MAHFIAAIEGNRGPASRLGTPKSGISARAQGWHVGVSIMGNVNPDTGEDEFTVWLTGGSSPRNEERLLGTFTVADLGQGFAR